jgi:hypothetical protein
MLSEAKNLCIRSHFDPPAKNKPAVPDRFTHLNLLSYKYKVVETDFPSSHLSLFAADCCLKSKSCENAKISGFKNLVSKIFEILVLAKSLHLTPLFS